MRVHIDQHVEFEGHRYSVPHSLVGPALEALITARAVEILYCGERVACHLRCAHKGGFTTVPEHLSAAHKAHLAWTLERLIHWGTSIGVATGRVVARLLEERQHPEHGYRACLASGSLVTRSSEMRTSSLMRMMRWASS